MPPSARSRPFAFTFHPNGCYLGNNNDVLKNGCYPEANTGTSSSSSSPSPWPKQKVISVNSFAPIEIENDHVKGRIMLVHDTGNEVGLEADEADVDPDQKRKGVILQFQLKFKKDSTKGADTASGLYIGGEMTAVLKLGFIMSKVVSLCGGYAKKKTEGRFHFVQGDAKTLPQLAFPISQIFTSVETKKGEDPPRLGSPELLSVKWQGPARIDVNTTSTYTFFYKTPFLDACSWELLNVPGVSPLPLERILGDVMAADVCIYDLGVAGSHANFRKGNILSFFFTRRNAGDPWLEGDCGIHTPLDDDASDASEASDLEEGHHDGAIEMVDDADGHYDDEDLSSDDEEGIDDEEEDNISRADSKALVELEMWRPPKDDLQSDPSLLSITLPYYIETIDRRRIRKLRVWYVFNLKDAPPSEGYWWTAKAINELASLCRPQPRLHAFRRRRGAHRGCQCYAVPTLEQFRQVVLGHLRLDTKLKRTVIASAKTDIFTAQSQCLPQEDTSTPGQSPTGESSRVPIRQPSTLSDHSQSARQKTPESASPPRQKTDESDLGLTLGPATDKASAGASSDTLANSKPIDIGSQCTTIPEEDRKDSKDSTGGKERTESKESRPSKIPEDSTDTTMRASTTDQGLVGKVGEKLKSFPQAAFDKTGSVVTQVKTKAHEAKNKANEVKNKVQGQRRGPIVPPRFFISSNSTACDKAFEHAKEGRPFVVHEGLVGAIHFEGRICEELLRLSKDGIARCFMPYDCDQPRLRCDVGEILQVKSIPGLFLGRFYRWEVHTLLRVFCFCSPDEADRYEWVRALTPSSAEVEQRPSQLPVVGETATLLTDLSRARRWRPSKRIVLNDRSLLTSEDLERHTGPQLAEVTLDMVLRLKDRPSTEELVKFIDETCRLKAISFRAWDNSTVMAFWMNVYHCLLLHGRLLLGTPKSRGELARFYSRVSYLVGVRCVSLKEIEHDILRVPMPTVSTSGRARGRQFFALCCLCGRRRGRSDPEPIEEPAKRSSIKGSSSSKSAKAESRSMDNMERGNPKKQGRRNKADDDPDGSEDGNPRSQPGRAVGLFGQKCLPKPDVPAGLDKMKDKVKKLDPRVLLRRIPSVCLFNGADHSSWAIPLQDMRISLCLNRTTESCLPGVALFSAKFLNEQMEEASRAFCAEFINVVLKDGQPTRIVLAPCLRGLKHELRNDVQALLSFIWPFLPKSLSSGDAPRNPQLRFAKDQGQPRRRQDLQRYLFSRQELNVDAVAQQAELQALPHSMFPTCHSAAPDNSHSLEMTEV